MSRRHPRPRTGEIEARRATKFSESPSVPFENCEAFGHILTSSKELVEASKFLVGEIVR